MNEIALLKISCTNSDLPYNSLMYTYSVCLYIINYLKIDETRIFLSIKLSAMANASRTEKASKIVGSEISAQVIEEDPKYFPYSFLQTATPAPQSPCTEVAPSTLHLMIPGGGRIQGCLAGLGGPVADDVGARASSSMMKRLMNICVDMGG